MAYNIHIGQVIREQFEKRGCSVSWLARQLHCDRSNVYDIFKRESIDTKRLYELGEILGYNFFEWYSENFERDMKTA